MRLETGNEKHSNFQTPGFHAEWCFGINSFAVDFIRKGNAVQNAAVLNERRRQIFFAQLGRFTNIEIGDFQIGSADHDRGGAGDGLKADAADGHESFADSDAGGFFGQFNCRFDAPCDVLAVDDVAMAQTF